MLRQLAEERLWIADMPAQILGVQYGARMTLVRLSDGGLFVHSPVALNNDLKREVQALGEVRCLATGSRFHFQHLAEWSESFLDAPVFVPPDFTQKIKGLEPQTLQDEPDDLWREDLQQLIFRGNALLSEVIFFDARSHTLILTDLCFNLPSSRSGPTRLFARLLDVLDHPAPSRYFRLTTREKRAASNSVDRILQWDFERIVLSHGDIVENQAKDQFRKAFDWLS